jgi:hypothetical protein
MTQTLDLGFVPWEAQEIDRWLREGKPELGWRGDNRLELRIGVLTANINGTDPHTKKYQRKGDRVAWRWEVWRHNEDGTEKRILMRKAEQAVDIIPSLIQIDPRTPGFVPTMDRVEKEAAQVDKEKSIAIREAVGEQAEHLWKLIHDVREGPSTFRQMPGRNLDKQD